MKVPSTRLHFKAKGERCKRATSTHPCLNTAGLYCMPDIPLGGAGGSDTRKTERAVHARTSPLEYSNLSARGDGLGSRKHPSLRRLSSTRRNRRLTSRTAGVRWLQRCVKSVGELANHLERCTPGPVEVGLGHGHLTVQPSSSAPECHCG